MRLLLVTVTGLLVARVQSADLEIRIPNDELSQQDGYYRLAYRLVSRSHPAPSSGLIQNVLQQLEMSSHDSTVYFGILQHTQSVSKAGLNVGDKQNIC